MGDEKKLAQIAAGAAPAEWVRGGEWNPLTMPWLPGAEGETLTVGRIVQLSAGGPYHAHALGRRIAGTFPTADAARRAVEQAVAWLRGEDVATATRGGDDD